MDQAEFPYPNIHKDTVKSMVQQLAATPGAKQLAARLKKMAEPLGQDDWRVTFSTPQQIEDYKELLVKGARAGIGRYELQNLKEGFRDYQRLQAMGIQSLPELRAALREYVPLRGRKLEEDPIKAKERALVGKPIPGFFPTPPAVIDQMLSVADIQPGMKVLEPSAGKGDIADAIKDRQPETEVDVVEPVGELREILQAKGHNLAGSNFLEHQGEYDRIVMNPPFDQGRWRAHLEAAGRMLAPGGRLVAILPSGAAKLSDKLLPGMICECTETISGAFKGASIDVTILVMDRPPEEIRPSQVFRTEHNQQLGLL